MSLATTTSPAPLVKDLLNPFEWIAHLEHYVHTTFLLVLPVVLTFICYEVCGCGNGLWRVPPDPLPPDYVVTLDHNYWWEHGKQRGR